MFNWYYLIDKIESFFDNLLSFFVYVFGAILLYFSPIKNFVHLVLLLIIIDQITGTYAAIKYKEFSWRKFYRNTLEKFVFYSSAIIVGYLLQQIIDDGYEIAKYVAFYIGVGEAKSIYVKISKITKTDILILLWESLKGKLDDMVSSVRSKRTG